MLRSSAGCQSTGPKALTAFGARGADALAASAHRNPLAVLLYATDDEAAAKTVVDIDRARSATAGASA